MDPTPELAARLDADRREAADRMTFGQRLLAGPAMFDIAVAMMRAGIRLEFPEADDQTVRQVVRERLRSARKYEARE